jgi:hypothetical protein
MPQNLNCFSVLALLSLFAGYTNLSLSRLPKKIAERQILLAEFSNQLTLSSVQENKLNSATERADKLIRKSLEAYGGESKVLSVKNVTYQYRVESLGDPPSKPIGVKTYFKNESFFRSEAKGENLDAITILNGEKGWVKVGDTTLSLPKKEIDPLRRGMIAQLRPDLLLLSFAKRRYTGRTEEDQQNLDQVEISGFIGGEYVRGRLSFDVNTALIYKYEFEIERDLPKGRGIVKGEEKYLRYGEKNSFKFPLEIVSKQGRKVSKLTIDEVVLDSSLSEALFQDPSPSAPPNQ